MSAAHSIPDVLVSKITLMAYQLSPHPIAKIIKTEFIPKFTYVARQEIRDFNDGSVYSVTTRKFKILDISTRKTGLIEDGEPEWLDTINLVEEKFKWGERVYKPKTITQIDELGVLNGFGIFDRTFLRDCECWGYKG